jgi:hypothetical protein
MNFVRFEHFVKFSGIKLSHADVLHRGQIDPQSLTKGARGPLAGHAGVEARAAPAMAGFRR